MQQESSPGWNELGLSAELLTLVEKAGFTTPTPVQVEAIPVAMAGQDVIASARTGSGKTAGFCFPMIEKLKGRRGTYGLILAPTRELALQTKQTLDIFGTPLGVTSAALIGGVGIGGDEVALRSGPVVLVGTPGRICDHLQRGNLWLEYIEILVLDEADRMLDMGFAKEVDSIVTEVSKKRQTLLFSATFSASIEKLARKILHNPKRITIGSPDEAPSSIDQELYWVNEPSKKRALLKLINEQPGTILVFTRTKDDASYVWRWLHAAGIHDATYLSSNRLQVHREQVLQAFKEGTYRVLVSTDVAGRGIHVENIACVINYGLPLTPEDYIHRIGRTGRKDARGKAISLVTPRDQGLVRRIEELVGKRLVDRFAPDFREEERPRPRGGQQSGRRSGPGPGRKKRY